jgi:hypothetical protein
MRALLRSALLPLAFVSGALLIAAPQPGCTPAETMGTGGAEAGDGKYHPEGNGQHISEAAACEALKTEQENKRLATGCPGTTRPCPDLLRAVFSTECMEYDQGSVQGCIDHYNKATTCEGIGKAIDECVVTPFLDSAPAGCP